MVGKLNRFLRVVHRLKIWHIMALLALVAIVWGVGLWLHYLQAEKEHIETVHVWTPDHAVPINSLFGVGLRLDSGYDGAIPWTDTHTFGEYQKLDAVANFFAVVGNQIRYLAIVRKSDGTVSVARTTIFANIPDPGFLLELRDVTFDPVTGMVTAQYTRPLSQILNLGMALPFFMWLLVGLIVAMACGLKLNKPVFSLRCTPA